MSDTDNPKEGGKVDSFSLETASLLKRLASMLERGAIKAVDRRLSAETKEDGIVADSFIVDVIEKPTAEKL